MHYLFPLVATSRWGETELIHDVDGFFAFTRTRRIDQKFTSWIHQYDWRRRTYEWLEIRNDWIIRDDRGRVIVQTTFGSPPHVARTPYHGTRAGRFEHRNGPVPGLLSNVGRRTSHGARKRHGGRGVAARIKAFNARGSRIDMD